MNSPQLVPQRFHGFTILELLVSMAILSIILVVMLAMVNQTSQAWRSSRSKVEMFRDARAGFESITQKLRQATLNTYYDYDDPDAPSRYIRKSDLHFLVAPTAGLLGGTAAERPGTAIFFVAPLGYTEQRPNFGRLNNLLNGSGFFVEYSEAPAPPAFLGLDGEPRPWRYRLRQFLEPTESGGMLVKPGPGWEDDQWVTDYFSGAPSAQPVHDIADNVILLVVLPQLPSLEDDGYALAPNYVYDSRSDTGFTTNPPTGSPVASITGSTIHQLPPLLRVLMVAIDEESASRLDTGSTPPAFFPADPIFEDASDFEGDLVKLEEHLQDINGLSYRIFQTSIALRGAKWSY